MATCAYCDLDQKLTKEHVWSDSILRIFDSVAPKTFDMLRKRVHDADPVIRDTCESCNKKLSDADDFARRLIGTHMKEGPPLNARLPLADDRLWRWVFKTAFNLDRASGQPVAWARPARTYLTGVDARPANWSLFFVPWDDLSPQRVALKFNVVHWLDVRRPRFDTLDSMAEEPLNNAIAMAVALKPGFGLFLPIVWHAPDSPELSALRAELLSHGWLDCVTDGTPSRMPFDVFSSGFFEMLVPSEKTKQIVDRSISNVKSAADAFGRRGMPGST